jgi:hypothetical protein
MLPKQVSQSSTQATGQQLAWCSARSHIGRAKRALTLIELLLAVSLSAAVMLAAVGLANAYGYANTEITDLRPLRSEAANLHTYIQDWLKRTHDIIAIESKESKGGQTTAVTRIYAFMGARPGRADDGEVNYDEIEALTWDFEWKAKGQGGFDDQALLDLLDDWGACAGCSSDYDGDNDVDVADLGHLISNWDTASTPSQGILRHHSYLEENLTQISQGKLQSKNIAKFLTNKWFNDNPAEQVWSNNVARCAAELVTDGGERPAVNIEITVYDFGLVKEGKGKQDDYIPPDYSIHVTGTPNVFIAAAGS